MSGETALVTGASSGIGEATVRALAAHGLQVFAGVRRDADAQRVRAERIEPVKLDVTKQEDIDRVAERLDDDDRRLRALVNNAGTAINGPVEVLPMEEWRRQFDVNFFGQVALTQALLPRLIADSGRVVNVSSIGGLVAGPLFGAYAGSKFALEAASDALRREVGRLGVDVIVVEPSAVATPIWDKGLATSDELMEQASDERLGRYDDLIEAARSRAGALAEEGMEPEEVARVIVDAVATRRPRTRYAVGRDTKVMSRLVRLLPDRTIDRLILRSLGLR